MSDRLAISATLSVLMMSAYVLLGNDAVRLPIGPEQLDTSAAPSLTGSPVDAARRVLLSR